IARPNALLKVSAPFIKGGLRCWVEPQEPERVEFVALGVDAVWIQRSKPLEGSPATLAGIAVRPTVDVFPARRCVRPRQDAEALNHAVIILFRGAADIVRHAARLRRPDHRDAGSIDVRPPTNSTVESVARRSIPGAQKEAAGCRKFFPVKASEKRYQLIAHGQHAVRILGQNLAKRFIARIIDD